MTRVKSAAGTSVRVIRLAEGRITVGHASGEVILEIAHTLGGSGLWLTTGQALRFAAALTGATLGAMWSRARRMAVQ